MPGPVDVADPLVSASCGGRRCRLRRVELPDIPFSLALVCRGTCSFPERICDPGGVDSWTRGNSFRRVTGPHVVGPSVVGPRGVASCVVGSGVASRCVIADCVFGNGVLGRVLLRGSLGCGFATGNFAGDDPVGRGAGAGCRGKCSGLECPGVLDGRSATGELVGRAIDGPGSGRDRVESAGFHQNFAIRACGRWSDVGNRVRIQCPQWIYFTSNYRLLA